ncbi:MAG TPA: hypothetical protein PL185_03595 [Flavobacteriales bacterium]|nr:hypothetical protein [Flavobacteriales bacterium]
MKQCLRVQLLLVFSLMLIPLASFSQSSANRGSIPAPYPKLKSTGNAEADRVNHEKAVQAWKETERIRVKSLQTTNPSVTNTKTKPGKEKADRLAKKNNGIVDKNIGKNQNQRTEVILDLPGYPKYVTTGNVELDEKNYQVAKAKWMDEHSDLYKQYVQQHSGHSGKLKRVSTTSGK